MTEMVKDPLYFYFYFCFGVQLSEICDFIFQHYQVRTFGNNYIHLLICYDCSMHMKTLYNNNYNVLKVFFLFISFYTTSTYLRL